MGRTLSRFFQSGSALLSSGNHRGVSEETRRKIRTVFDALRTNPRVTVQRLEGLLQQIPKNENILVVHNEEGYNLLQKCVGINNVEMMRWILSRNPDLNRGTCSFPLHIACLKGYEECVVELIKHGARIDVETRMCWPGPHSQNCEERGKHHNNINTETDRTSDRMQNAIFYAIDGDEVSVLQLLVKSDHSTGLLSQKRPLLHVACERGAWQCTRFLIAERSEEMNLCYDEYYPVHHAVLHHAKFLNLLISNHATTTVLTATGQMTLLHVLFLIGRKSAEDTLQTCRLLLDNGLRELVNAPDSLGNTPLHGLIVRYSLEEARYGYHHDNQPWNKWDMMHLVRFLLQNGARPSINQPGNSALACVLRHVKDWEFRYDLLNMLLQDGGNTNIAGRDGSVPLMVCLVPLINKDPLFHLTHSMKVCYLNCVRILCKHGANPNCRSRSTLTPLHVLVFTASENIALSRQEEKAANFDFIRNLLVLLLQYGLDPNAYVSNRTPHILQSIVEKFQNTRAPSDMNDIHSLIVTLLQYGADPDITISHQPRNLHILTYYIQLIARKEEILMDPMMRYRKVIHLFYDAMSHDALNQSLTTAHTLLSSALPNRGLEPLRQLVQELSVTPRSLKQIARVHICRALDRKSGLHCNKLPSLPNRLKEYMMYM